MIPAGDSTREERLGGRWSTPTLLDDLLYLAALERATVHLLAAWVPKVGDLDEKLGLAAGLEEGMARACALRNHALALLERDESGLTACPEWIEPLRTLDCDGHPIGLVEAVAGGVRPYLLERYQELGRRLDPMYDARTHSTIAAAIASLAVDVTPIGTPAPKAPSHDIHDALSRARSNRLEGRARLDDLLWGPLDRVPVPSRPAHRRRPLRGSRTHYRKSSRLEPEDIAGELNDNVMAELSALELLCRCSYEHPGRPWSFHTAILRHATDEARHAAIFRRELARGSFTEDALEQHATNYEYAYEFPECEPGSDRELVWRLLVLCTVLEALAIDKLPVEIGGRDWVCQAEFARALDYIAADELFHTENGLRLTRRLCEELNLHPMLERELVHGRFFGSQRDLRLEYLQADPERAAREIAILEAPDPDGVPYGSRTEVERRLRASFTLDECEQVERWRYNPIPHPLLDAGSAPV